MPIYTDIATEIYKKGEGDIPRGVDIKHYTSYDIEVTRVEIKRDGLNRAKGHYSVLDMPNLALVDDRNDRYISTVCNELGKMLPEEGLLMVVGLGNEKVTADSLGALTARKIFVTRMLSDEGDSYDFRLRKVCAFTPGVSGRTGIETAESIVALIKSVKPVAVICVDSLYTNDPSRLGCTVQITDTGICPGGNYNLNEKILGCKTVAVGVPTMMQYKHGKGQLVVTARQLDLVMEKAANVLALSINKAAQTMLTTAEISYLTS